MTSEIVEKKVSIHLPMPHEWNEPTQTPPNDTVVFAWIETGGYRLVSQVHFAGGKYRVAEKVVKVLKWLPISGIREF